MEEHSRKYKIWNTLLIVNFEGYDSHKIYESEQSAMWHSCTSIMPSWRVITDTTKFNMNMMHIFTMEYLRYPSLTSADR